jgi:hypothetical protein
MPFFLFETSVQAFITHGINRVKVRQDFSPGASKKGMVAIMPIFSSSNWELYSHTLGFGVIRMLYI